MTAALSASRHNRMPAINEIQVNQSIVTKNLRPSNKYSRASSSSSTLTLVPSNVSFPALSISTSSSSSETKRSTSKKRESRLNHKETFPQLAKSTTIILSPLTEKAKILDSFYAIPAAIRTIVYKYLEDIPPTEISRTQVQNSFAYFRRNRAAIFKEDENEGYRPLNKWLLRRIMTSPKGGSVFGYNFESEVTNALTKAEVAHLARDSEVIKALTVQPHARRGISCEIMKELADGAKKEPAIYPILARFLGGGEYPLNPSEGTDIVRNSYAASREWNQILQDPVVFDNIAAHADKMEELDLSTYKDRSLKVHLYAPFAINLINRAIALNQDKGIDLLCRSLSNQRRNYAALGCESYGFDDEFVSSIATRFAVGFNDRTRQPLSMAFSCPLWKPIHKYLKDNYGEETAMGWFIATINSGALCDLYEALKFAGYIPADLTSEVCNKITCLRLSEKHNSVCVASLIDSCKNLQELWLANENMRGILPSHCQQLKRLTLRTNRFPLFKIMSELEHLDLTFTVNSNSLRHPHDKFLTDHQDTTFSSELPISLPKLQHFICRSGAYKLLPSMPRVRTIELYDTYVSTLPYTPKLERLIVHSNVILQEIAVMPRLKVIGLDNCPKLRFFFASSNPIQGIPGTRKGSRFNLNAMPAQLLLFYANNVGDDPDGLGNPNIMSYCNAWNERWIKHL